MHCYLNYGNLAWGGTNRTNLKKLRSLQKHDIRLIFNKKGVLNTLTNACTKAAIRFLQRDTKFRKL